MKAGPRRGVAVVVTAAGTLSHLTVLTVIAVSTLLAPPWAVALGVVVWLGSLAPLVRAARHRPWAAPVVSLGVLGAWMAFLTVGDHALGWTA